MLQESPAMISLSGDTLLIEGLKINDKELADYIRSVPPDDQSTKLTHLMEIGLVCVQRASLLQDRDFVKNQLDGVLKAVETNLAQIPDSVKGKIMSQLGTGEGQALHPVDRKIDEVSKVLKDRIEDIRNLLNEDIDPEKETSKVAQVFKKLERALDPEYVYSVPKTITNAIESITGEDGAISKSVKEVVTTAMKPLQDEVDRLSKEIVGQSSADEAILQTIEKGQAYEESVVERLQTWSAHSGIEVHHVGTDNKHGDVTLVVSPQSIVGIQLKIVIETRDRQNQCGRKRINDSMESSMSERTADHGIYLSKERGGLSKEIGDWAEGESTSGSWIATTDENLFTAVRVLIAKHQIDSAKAEKAEVDTEAIAPQLERIRSSLKRIANINKKVTTIRQGANDIQQESEVLRDEIKDALVTMEDCLRTPVTGNKQ